jgi:hypothetical protein
MVLRHNLISTRKSRWIVEVSNNKEMWSIFVIINRSSEEFLIRRAHTR